MTVQAGPISLTKQTALVSLVVVVALAGAGVGAFNTINEPDSTGLSVSTATATPPPPTVEATAPPPATPTNTETAAESPTETATDATETTTETPEPASEVAADLTLTATDPDDVANAEGHVTGLRGELSGTLSWAGDVDSIVLVVSSWSPHDGWAEKRRVSINPTGEPVTLADALNNTRLHYATGDRAAAFDNPEDATVVTRRGYVGVTAVFFDDGQEVDRVTRTADYRFDVRNVGTVDVTLGSFDSGEAGISVANASPGASGAETFVVGNNGSANGSLQLFLRNVSGAENGFTGPEARVDDDQTSELLDAIGIRVAAVEGANRTYLLGGQDRYVALGSYSDARLGSVSLPSGAARRIVVEWHVPAGLGNEAMSDSVSFDLQFQLVSY